MSVVPLGFVPEPTSLPVEQILLSRRAPAGLNITRKYKQIRSSIEEVGLIEPLSVAPLRAGERQYLLLDGHVRLAILCELGHVAAPCLVATDDESYTYNNRINRLSTVQEHLMMRRAVERGLSPKRLAKALSVDESLITKKLNLLEGICPEAVELFRDRQFSVEVTRVLRKMKPNRQVECVELMISANNLTVGYAEALLVGTPTSALADGRPPRRLHGVTPEQMVRMEREMANLQGQYRLVEQTYGQDILNLVLARGYLAKLIENSVVEKYLRHRQPEMFEQFAALVAATALE